jgi:hypothetical protein
MMVVNSPDVLREVRAQFDRYERAFMTHDVAALNAYFWNDHAVTRYGIADKQLGHEAIAAFRAASAAPDFTRALLETRITTFGLDFAVAQTEFVRSDTRKRGFQTQTWVRMPDGWKIVAAHVSMIDIL